MNTTKLIAAWIQVIVLVLVVGFSTWQLFEGQFQVAFATLPFLFAYYIFVVARLKNRQERFTEDPEADGSDDRLR